jgi:hypothetical protein
MMTKVTYSWTFLGGCKIRVPVQLRFGASNGLTDESVYRTHTSDKVFVYSERRSFCFMALSG